MPPLPGMLGGLNIRLSVDGVGVNLPSGRVEDNGTFKIAGVNPGKYYIAITGAPGTYIKQMTFAGQDVTRRQLDLTGAGGSLNIVVSKKVAELSGAVANSRGEPMAGANVSVWPRIPNLAIANGGVRTLTTDQNGAFRMANMIPGDYYAAAWEDLPDPGLGQYAAFLAGFNGEAASVKLDENGKQTVQAKLVERAKIAAQIAKLP